MTSTVSHSTPETHSVESDIEFIKNLSRKFSLIKQNLESYFFERDLIIESILLAIFSKDNSFIYGPTGTGKTNLINCVMEHFPFLKVFMEQGGHDTTKEDLFGPINIKRYTQDEEYSRLTDGFILDADVVFIDEFSDIPGKVQRALLGISSKNRFFKNGSEKIYWKGRTCVFASNFFRKTDETKAVNDRILLKASVDYMSSTALTEYVIKDETPYDNKGIFFTKEELDSFDRILKNVKLNRMGKLLCKEVFEKYNTELTKPTSSTRTEHIFNGLSRLSDRAIKESFTIIKTHAILSNNIYFDSITNNLIVRTAAIFKPLEFMGPFVNGKLNLELSAIIKNVNTTIYNKICVTEIPIADPKTGTIKEQKLDIDVAYKQTMDAYEKVCTGLNEVPDKSARISPNAWNVSDPGSLIVYIKSILNKLEEATRNSDVFKHFPIISTEDAARIQNAIHCINMLFEHIKNKGENYKLITYAELIEALSSFETFNKKNKRKV